MEQPNLDAAGWTWKEGSAFEPQARQEETMTPHQKPLVQQFDQLLEEQGAVSCLVALAHAMRGANDREEATPRESVKIQRCYVREYLASQLMSLAGFWRVQLPESDRR